MTRSSAPIRWVGAVAAAVLVAGCASGGSPSAGSSPATVSSAVSRTAGPTASADPAVPDWPALQAALAQADAQLTTAKTQGWWAGPVCSPDIEQHREQAGQDPLSDEQLRAGCAATIAEFWASKDDYDALQALDESARAAEFARVGALLRLPAGQEPTIGQVVVVHGCEQGWITDPADCTGIPTG